MLEWTKDAGTWYCAIALNVLTILNRAKSKKHEKELGDNDIE